MLSSPKNIFKTTIVPNKKNSYPVKDSKLDEFLKSAASLKSDSKIT